MCRSISNMSAGSSIPSVCVSSYDCNERQYHAMCCAQIPPNEDNGGGSSGGSHDVPEFGILVSVAILGLVGLFIFSRRK